MKPIRALALLVFLLTLPAALTQAKGPANKIEVKGPGLTQTVSLTDPALMANLSFGGLEDFQTQLTTAPENLGDGYELIRYFENGARYDVFDHVHYYPAADGVQSYVYYDGLVNGSSEYDGEWFRPTPEGELAMNAFIERYVEQADTLNADSSIALTGHTGPVTDIVWSPDGSLLATRSEDWEVEDFTARIWRADGTLVAVLDDHTCQVLSLAWSPDGQTLASGSCDKSIRLWKPDGTLIRTIQADIGSVYALAWSPDGKVLASGTIGLTSYNKVQWWDIEGNLLKTLETKYSGGKFYRLAWSPDGQYLVGGAIDFSEWTVDGTLVFSHESCEHCTPAWGFAWSPDSQRWAIGNESGEVWVYDVSGKQIGDLRNNGNVDRMIFSPDATMLLGGNSIWTWNGSYFNARGSLGGGRIAALAWSPDGSLIAYTNAFSGSSLIHLTDRDGNQLGTLEGQDLLVGALAWSPDGLTLASGSNDKTARLWDMSGMMTTASVLKGTIGG